jgi:2-keto-4-pentenoate hydratase
MKTTTPIIMNKSIDDPRILRGMEKQLKLRQDRLNAGEKNIGWKVGFGAPASLENLRLDGPLVGFLTDKVLLLSNATISIGGWTRPAMEPEIAIYMEKDLSTGSDRETTRAAIASLGPAIELADVHFPPDDVEAILADNIYNRHVILGRADPSRAGCVLDGLVGRVSRNAKGMPPVTDFQALTGDLIGIVGRVANVLSMFGETLRADDVIITGSIVPPLWVESKDAITYSLEPIDSVSVKFA